MNDKRAIRLEVEVPGTPEEVWAATRPENAPSRRLLAALDFRECPPSRPLASWDPGDLTFRWERGG